MELRSHYRIYEHYRKGNHEYDVIDGVGDELVLAFFTYGITVGKVVIGDESFNLSACSDGDTVDIVVAMYGRQTDFLRERSDITEF